MTHVTETEMWDYIASLEEAIRFHRDNNPSEMSMDTLLYETLEDWTD